MPDAPFSRPVTIYAVAKRAGVSIATVSRVLQGSTPTTAATRERVLQAVDELGYVPLRGKSSLLRLESHGLVLPSVGGPHYSELLSGYEAVAGHLGVSVMLIAAEAAEDHLVEQVLDLSGKVDGLVIAHSTVSDDVVAKVADRVPVVLTGRTPVPGCDALNVENTDPTLALVRHLVSHGSRTPRFVGLAGNRDMQQRYAGFLAGVAEAGLDVPRESYRVPAVEDFGAGVAAELLAEDPRPDALVCANDELALAVMKALWLNGVRAPQDVMITGWDDIMPARYTVPGLTTVRQPTQRLGRMLAERLHVRIAQGEPAGEPVTLGCDVVVRGTCGCPEPGGLPS